MPKQLSYLLFLLLFPALIGAQGLLKSATLNTDMDDAVKECIYIGLDSLFAQILNKNITDQYIATDHTALTKEILNYLKEVEENEAKEAEDDYQKELINIYPIGSDKFSLDIAYLGKAANSPHPTIRLLFQLIAEVANQEVKFSLPLATMTQHWKTKSIGNIEYHYRDTINVARAEKFAAKNTLIAQKMGVPTEAFQFYMSSNYQEILSLVGIKYNMSENGQAADGYGVVAGKIFSIQNNEDFSHDIFHYYSGKINERKNRNWAVEEGIAYSWGNAYYADTKGEMIDQNTLVAALKNYLKEHPDVSLLTLFEDNTKIFNHLSPKISVRSTLSSLLCDKVEQERGMKGITTFINCGRRTKSLENFFTALEELVGVNRENFDAQVRQLINSY